MSVCDTWPAIAPVIPAKDFIGWGAAGYKKNCYDYAVGQLAKAGYTLASPGWVLGTGLVFQTYVSEKVAKLSPGFQESEFKLAVEYTKVALASNVPVLFGVDTHPGSPNNDKVTDHFVVAVGMGTDKIGKYFLFYDNATGKNAVGTSLNNRIYCNCEKFSLVGVADSANDYTRTEGYQGGYTLTQIRKSTKALIK